ncbi:PAS domain S-box protein [Sphingomonas sp. PB2P19]|uniref:PAS domain S-box protein n=1 Tax=Sphingomonas rhamnosi TaxID=3096156 RepID=UPI002FC60758
MTITGVCVASDTFELLVSFVTTYEAWQLDEVIVLLLASGVAAGVLLVRRSRELRREIVLRTAAEQASAALAHSVAMDGLAERRLLEEAVRANEQRLASILATAHQSIVTIDRHGLITQWNRHAELTFGWPAQDVVGRLMSEVIVPPEARAAHDAGLARFMASKTARLIGSRVEVQALRRNGALFPVELALSATNVGEDWQFTALIQDISERRAQTALFENAFDHAPIGMALVALDGRLLKLNAAFCDLMGYDPAEAETLDFAAITHPDDRERDMDLTARLRAGEIPRYQLEQRYVRKSGRIVWIRLSVSMVLAEDGTPRHYIAQFQDLSAERESEDRYRLLADSANDMVGLYTVDGRCIYMSPSSQRILGYAPHALVGQSVLEFVPAGERFALLKATRRLHDAPPDATVTHLTRLRNSAGDFLHIEFVARLVASDDEGWRIVAACRDVTMRIEAQNALEDRSKDLVRAHEAAETLAATARQAQALFEGIFENSPDLNFVHDVVDGAFPMSFMNAAAERALGTTVAEARGADLAALFVPGVADSTRREMAIAVASGEVRRLIEQDRTAGNDTTYDVGLVPLRDDTGRVVRIFVSKRDISILKGAEEAALQANALMRSAEKIAHMGYVVIDLTTQIMSWSPEIWAILDVDPASKTASIKTILERCHPDDRARGLGALETAIADGLTEYDNNYRLVLPSGEIRYVMSRGTIRRVNGVAVSVLTVIVDISNLKRAEEKARESDQRYRLMAENSTDVIVTSDLEGRTTFVSPASVSITGHTIEDRMGGRADEIVHPDDIADLRATFHALRDGAVGKHVRWRARHKTEDRWVWLESSPAMLRDPATQLATGYLDVIRDVTAQKEQEDALAAARLEAERAIHSKERFLANMSHELRTPLNSIIGFSRLLNERNGLGAEDQRRVRLVHNAGLALHAVVDNVLDFSKLQADRLVLHCSPFDVAGFFAGTVALLEPQAATRDVTLLTDIAADVPARLVGDVGRLRQVLLNLLSNAVKFTQDGSVTTRVVLIGEEDCDARLRIEVIDTGGGIPKDRIPTLFNRFIQASAATAVQYGGTGLGLAISRQLLTLMGGEIGVVSEPGLGSTFWVELALPISDDVECVEHHALASGVLSLPGKRILVVDDVDLNRELMLAMLSKYSCAVELAEDGLQALAALDRTPFDLILMDCQMPVMDGFAATRAIRTRGGSAATMPIIALTASAQPEHRARCQEAGMDEHLTKPLDPGALESVLSRYLSGSDSVSGKAALDRPSAYPPVALCDPPRDDVTVSARVPDPIADSVADPIPDQELPRRAATGSLQERYAARKAEMLSALDAMIRAGLFTDTEIGALAVLAHNLAGTAGMFGEPELGDAAAELDAGLDHWHPDERADQIRECAVTIRRTALRHA